jgi:urease accessory protein
MLQFIDRADKNHHAVTTVTLPIEKRIKSRLRVALDDGRDAGIVLARGEVLQHGDKLQTSQGEVIEVVAAAETLSQVRCHDMQSFARACYHLGNRHVPVEIVADAGTIGVVSYLHDHVLDDMIKGFGLEVTVAEAPFNPEPGAYGGGHVHGHSHGHSH